MKKEEEQVFKWAKAHNKKHRDKWVYKTERHNNFHLPMCGIKGSSQTFSNNAVYYYDRKVLSFEFIWWSPFEWLDSREMIKRYGPKAAEVLGADKFLYYIQQPTKSKARGERKEPYIFFTQFVIKAEEPPEEDRMKEAFEILTNAAIEGEECGEYRYNRFDRSSAPTDRTASKLAYRRKMAAEEEELSS